ncbi:MAG: histidine kinase [Vicinamibacterales bacterium]
MHPILARRERWSFYVLAWGLGACGLALTLVMTRRADWPVAVAVASPMAGLWGGLGLSAQYVCQAVPVRSSSAWRISGALLAASLLSAASAVGMAGLVASALEQALAQTSWAEFGQRVASTTLELSSSLLMLGCVLFLFACLLSYLVIEVDQSQENERRAWALKVHAAEAELRALRAQVDPHFLFNSLNSVGALISVDPSAARRMCVMLADFLRSSLRVRASRITLEREVGLAQQYLSIEKVRFGDRLRFSIEIDAGARHALVPPLILQPLIENAVTHGIASTLDGGLIRIACSTRDDKVCVTIENPCDADRAKGRGVGLGLNNVRARLSAEFGRLGSVVAEDEGTAYRVTLAVPCAADDVELRRPAVPPEPEATPST